MPRIIEVAVAVIACGLFLVTGMTTVRAQEDPSPEGGGITTESTASGVDEPPGPAVTVEIASDDHALSRTVTIVLALTAGSVLPAILVLTTSFTRFVIVLSITRNALGLHTIPPTTVLIGLATILTFFVMSPTLSEVNEESIQPLLAEEIDLSGALSAGYAPLREFMLTQTEEEDLRLFVDLSASPQPRSPSDIGAATLIPAFVLSELRTAFLIGFIIYLPFLVVDLVVSSVLMSLGMMMLPPIFISLPLKLLLFILVDGWALIVTSMVASVNGVGG